MARREEHVIQLKCSDGKVVEAESRIMMASKTIKDMVELLGVEEEDHYAIPLPNVSSKTLKEVIDFCKYEEDRISRPDVADIWKNPSILPNYGDTINSLCELMLVRIIMIG